ncbi:ribose transport system permease protein [Pseudomonas lurida]|jgi:ribose transport system permease protein|uniref:ABC transporter permease n=1 Tax=Pseudomonas lurida TaxID=244566 RepID=UPI000F0662EA|nr:ABC transporter permease [Pseudomonas lurida]MCF5025008.1 ABC transporter permease [Pseudomonas lurida]MCF5308185.1 ABC transporter permease [Pseudomonas lurida]MCF5325932.1 ABC transporter permease [Pseudomonas lurida]VVM93914.1 Ribose import permease protein RbsC [Pseudomonas fluorescens]
MNNPDYKLAAAEPLQHNSHAGEGRAHRRSLQRLFLEHNALVMLVLLAIVASVLSPDFFTYQNLGNLLRQLTPLLLVSIGMLIVILTAGIDLSVASVAAVGGIVVAMTLNVMPVEGGLGLLLAVTVAVASGVLMGLATGTFIAYFRMAPFIATLAMMTAGRGLAFILSNGQPQRLDDKLTSAQWLRDFGRLADGVLGIPWPVWLAILVTVIFALILRYNTYGRLTIACGSNETAVRLAGIPVERYKLAAYGICGGLAALAGVVIASRSGVAAPSAGIALELDAIAACVIGGALLTGGKGTIFYTVVGVLVLGLIGNIMNLLSVPAYPQQIIKGAIIVIAVLLQGVGRRDARI